MYLKSYFKRRLLRTTFIIRAVTIELMKWLEYYYHYKAILYN